MNANALPIYECKFFSVTKEFHDALSDGFPKVKLTEEYAKMNAYAMCHPYWHRHKSKKWMEGIYEWVSNSSMQYILPGAVKSVNSAIKRR